MPVEKTGSEIRISAPLTEDDIALLKAGDHVRFYGTIYTARDAAHKRLITAFEEGKAPPVDLTGQIIYYVGPSPARPGRVIGSAGPTTSMRMDPFTPQMLDMGVKMLIGKGGRGAAVQQSLQDHKAAYCLAIGGAGALLSKTIKGLEVIAYEDLGTESMKKLEVEGFPAILCCDMFGGDLLQQGKDQWRQTDKLGSYEPIGPLSAGKTDGGGK
ncbi:MAG: fumarate hydratase C-terminal domain-containing protein [Chloroflexi bacterium]|nr:fumarate hydratase C-terminal domain-containing protein [Chloroflexota bacterium]